MEESRAQAILKPYFNELAAAHVKGFNTYRTNYPNRATHRRTTIANVVCDEVWSAIINAFDRFGNKVRPMPVRHGLRFLGVQGPSGEIEILLWFKKVDSKHCPSSNATQRAKKLMKGGNLELFPTATVLIVGYHLNREETRLVRVSVARMLNGRSEWHFDLILPENIVPISTDSSAPPTTTTTKVVIKRVKQERFRNDA